MISRPDQPGPLLRRGPRPILLHLALSWLRSVTSLVASMPSSEGSQTWMNAASRTWKSPAAQARMTELLAGLARTERPDDFPQAVWLEAARQDRDLIAGIAAYRRHPWRRDLPDPPAIWTEGEARLLDYGGSGPPVVFVPSLINRAYVLDLMPGGSMMRFLAAQGIRPLLLDWGWPDEAARRFSLTDVIAGRLERALMAARPDAVVGYCMGALLTLAAAQRRPDLVRRLGLLAPPWDFHAPAPEPALLLARMLPLLEPAFAATGAMGIDALQMSFATLDPWAIAAKYQGFAKLDPDSDRARRFVALEDWLNDGVPLAAPIARECLASWYGRNEPVQGRWLVAGLPVDPAAVDVPCLVAIPSRDRIVPPESSRALARALPRATVLTPPAGHIGMAAGATAETALWRPLRDWLLER